MKDIFIKEMNGGFYLCCCYYDGKKMTLLLKEVTKQDYLSFIRKDKI